MSADRSARTWPEGWDAMIARHEARRAPIVFGPGEGLPAADIDLAPLRTGFVMRDEREAAGLSGYARKYRMLSRQLEGCSELVLLHGLLISCLRKRSWPDAAPVLFRRLWTEEREHLLHELPGRWLISAAITFADHGIDEGERSIGQSMLVMFSLLKLTEFERLFSGSGPERPFPFGQRHEGPLPLELEPFSLRDGGLDINLIAPLIVQAREQPVLGPLALTLIERLDTDPGTIFRRIATMRRRLEKRDRRAARDGQA